MSFNQLQNLWQSVEADYMSSAPMRRLAEGRLTVSHYAAYLRETFFYTREDPQIQAACTSYFRGEDRRLVKTFLKHAISEVGHDEMALNDLDTLGYDISAIRSDNPLPNTIALISFPYYAMQYRSPIAYLGYLYFLEFLPTSRGSGIIASLRKMGIPDGALSFLIEHNTIDIHHNKLMEKYANDMLRNTQRIDEVAFSMRVTANLFANMVEGAFQSADSGTGLRRK